MSGGGGMSGGAFTDRPTEDGGGFATDGCLRSVALFGLFGAVEEELPLIRGAPGVFPPVSDRAKDGVRTTGVVEKHALSLGLSFGNGSQVPAIAFRWHRKTCGTKEGREQIHQARLLLGQLRAGRPARLPAGHQIAPLCADLLVRIGGAMSAHPSHRSRRTHQATG
jgi:hypothetical protein